jgi:hypothetical protein
MEPRVVAGGFRLPIVGLNWRANLPEPGFLDSETSRRVDFADNSALDGLGDFTGGEKDICMAFTVLGVAIARAPGETVEQNAQTVEVVEMTVRYDSVEKRAAMLSPG